MTATRDDSSATNGSPIGGPAPAGQAGGTMTLFEHLAELRNRLIISIVAVVAGTVVVWFFYDSGIQFMLHPYHAFVTAHPGIDYRRVVAAVNVSVQAIGSITPWKSSTSLRRSRANTACLASAAAA